MKDFADGLQHNTVMKFDCHELDRVFFCMMVIVTGYTEYWI